MLVIQRPSVEAIGTSDNNRQKFSIGPLDPGLGHTRQLVAPHVVVINSWYSNLNCQVRERIARVRHH